MAKKIFVTGSESFVGKELIAQLQKQEFEITGIDMVAPVDPTYQFYKADIRDESIAHLIPKEVDAVVHLAALSRDSDCRDRARECFDVNVMGTLNIIEAAKAARAKQFIFASSEWVYDKFEHGEEKNEDAIIDVTSHTSEYAFSKLTSEVNLRIQFQRGFTAVTILRFGIIYGPRKNNWSAVESIMSNVKNQDEIVVGSLKTGRRFVHVSDISCGIIKAIGHDGFDIINLTGDRVVTLGEIIEQSEKIFGKKVKITESSPGSASIRNPANARAKTLLGWQPEIDLRTGLESLLPYV